MARDFSGTGEYLSGSFVPGNISNYPFTMAVWVRLDSVGADAVIWELVDISGSNIKQRLYFRSSGADFWAQSRNPTSGAAISGGTVTANTWHHACGVFTLSNSRACFQDGANKGTNSSNISFDSNIDSTVIGGFGNSGVFSTNFNGKLAEAGVWDVALDDFEVAALGKGYSPRLIRPGNLVGYWPIIGRTSPEIDLAEGNDLTVTGTPDTYAHPRIIYPKRSITIPVAAAAPPAGDIAPLHYHHRHHNLAG